METVLLWSKVAAATDALLAVILLWLLLRLWNWLSGDRFDETYQRIRQDPVGAGVYLGVRFLGLCVLVGLVVS